MDLFCKVCDGSIFENGIYNDFITPFRKKIDNSLRINYVIHIVTLDKADKSFNDYVSSHNKKIDFYIINCECLIESDNKSTKIITTDFTYNTNINEQYECLLLEIDFLKSTGHKFYIFNQMTIKTINDRCNISYECYINQPMSMCERKINMNARNPQMIISLDRNKNHPLIRKYSHITFNN